MIFWSSCDITATHSEVIEDAQSTEGRVFLHISLGEDAEAFQTKSGSTLKSGPSINTAGTYFEDRVRDLVIYIYDSETGENPSTGFRAFGGLPMNKPVSFVVDFPYGTYDFYFIANMPTTGENSSSSLTDRASANAYLQKLITLDKLLFTGPIKDGQDLPFFPMARVYKNQVIKRNTSNSAGSSENNPVYFRPINDEGVVEDHILLNRSVAKIETILKGAGAAKVKSIELVNGVNEYSLLARTNNEGKTINIENTGFKKRTDSHVLYTPEVIQTAPRSWTEDYTGNDINYIRLTMEDGHQYKVPIASNYTGGNYVDFIATSEAKFNVLRNNHYRFTLNIPERDKKIEVKATILPWTLAESAMDFGEAAFAFTLLNPNKENEQTILLHQQESIKVQFKLDKPKGGLWKASITNGLDFEILPAEGATGAVGGIADDQKTYEFTIRSLKPYNGTNRYTELFITVNGDEVQLIEGSTDEPGPGKRYVFKQVE